MTCRTSRLFLALITSITMFAAVGCEKLEPIPAGVTSEPGMSSPTWISTPAQAVTAVQTAASENKQIAEPTPATQTLSTVCSPLHGFQLVQLSEIISTPFDPPPPGQDGGHHGVDFGFYSYGAFTQMEGLPIQSVLSGHVAAVIDDRPPYGNMIMVETALADLPQSWRDFIADFEPLDEYQTDGRLACPTPEIAIASNKDQSLYILYAHMAEPPTLSIGDPVGCGQQIGLVGTTGFSVNAHLHLEMRVSSGQVQFLQLAHYVNNATAEEMANYCTWRTSPLFRLIDPMALLQLNP